MLKQAVEEAVSEAVAAIPVPRDGKSVTTEDVQPMIQELVSASIPELPDVKSLVNEAIAALPAAEPGKDGEMAGTPCRWRFYLSLMREKLSTWQLCHA